MNSVLAMELRHLECWAIVLPRMASNEQRQLWLIPLTGDSLNLGVHFTPRSLPFLWSDRSESIKYHLFLHYDGKVNNACNTRSHSWLLPTSKDDLRTWPIFFPSSSVRTGSCHCFKCSSYMSSISYKTVHIGLYDIIHIVKNACSFWRIAK